MPTGYGGQHSGGPQNGQNSVRTHFKTPEGRYRLAREKMQTLPVLQSHRSATRITVVILKDKPAVGPWGPTSGTHTPPSTTSATSRFRALVGVGNGGAERRSSNGAGRFLLGGRSSQQGSAHDSPSGGKSGGFAAEGEGGVYVVFNTGDALLIADHETQSKDPLRSLHFTTCMPTCHAFNEAATDGHDLVVGTNMGDVYTASFRLQLQDLGRKLVGASHFNKDGCISNSRCTAVAWVPSRDGQIVAAHQDGNLYLYDRHKDGGNDASFPPIKDPSQFQVSHAKSSKSNPMARWHISTSAINDIAFSPDGALLAVVGRDGCLRIFDWAQEALIGGCKSYYGGLLCCTWSGDGKCVLTGGEDDLVSLYSLDLQAVVAWGEGHNSWVSSVAFDPFCTHPMGEDEVQPTYRFGSTGQDTQLLLWDFAMEDIASPASQGPTLPPPRGSFSGPHGLGPSTLVGDTHNMGGAMTGLAPSPQRADVPKFPPIMAHRVHAEPLSDLRFTKDSILTSCYDGFVRVWLRPSVLAALEATSATTVANKQGEAGTVRERGEKGSGT